MIFVFDLMVETKARHIISSCGKIIFSQQASRIDATRHVVCLCGCMATLFVLSSKSLTVVEQYSLAIFDEIHWERV